MSDFRASFSKGPQASPRVPFGRWVLAGIASLIVASVVGAIANGAFQMAEANKAAKQLGYGLSGREALDLQHEVGSGPGCTGGGAATFFLVWGAVAYALRPRRPASAGRLTGPKVFQPVFMTYTLAGAPSVFLLLIQGVLAPGAGLVDVLMGAFGGAVSLGLATIILAGGGALLRPDQRKAFSTIWLVLSVVFNLIAAILSALAFTSAHDAGLVLQALSALVAPLGPFLGRKRLLAMAATPMPDPKVLPVQG